MAVLLFVKPPTLPLSTPNLYLSGLTFPSVDGQWSNFSFSNPYYWLQAAGCWINDAGGQIYWYNGVWTIAVSGYYETGDENSGYNGRDACTKTASSSALPLSGWTNQSWVTGGTIAISTTP